MSETYTGQVNEGDECLFSTFPPGPDGRFELTTALDGPPARPSTGGKTLPAPICRVRQRKQQTPRRKKPAGIDLVIKKEQATTELIIPRAIFRRVVIALMHNMSHVPLRIQANAIDSLQDAAETFVVDVFTRADAARDLTKTITLSKAHFDFAKDQK